ncbi:MAG: 50S ribosomal protein L29 [Candidatus Woesearchaeota archaeon]
MNFAELRALPAQERAEKKSELELELMKARAQIAAGTSPKNPGLVRKHKKMLARLKAIEEEDTK